MRPRGVVVWCTGLPSSGKSTLAARLTARLRADGRAVCLLDGDEVRAALDPTPGYDEPARDRFYHTLGNLAALVAGQGLIAVVAATAPRRSHRAAARAVAPAFVEVHVATPLAECQARDPKGLYAAARAGRIGDLPGAGASYEPPLAAEITARGGHDDDAITAIVGRLETAFAQPVDVVG